MNRRAASDSGQGRVLQPADVLPAGSTAIDRALLALSAAAGSLYLLTCAGPPHLPGLVLKAPAVPPPAAIAIRLLSGPEHWLRRGALAAAAIGDGFLKLTRRFVQGLGALRRLGQRLWCSERQAPIRQGDGRTISRTDAGDSACQGPGLHPIKGSAGEEPWISWNLNPRWKPHTSGACWTPSPGA